MFRSVDHALKWAFRVSGIPVVKGSSVFGMIAGGGVTELSALDKHGQAALIWSLVERVIDYPAGRAYVLAQYCHALDCRDWADRKDLSDEQRDRVTACKSVADELTVAVIASLPTGVHARRGYAGLVRAYFGQQIGVHSLRRDLACRIGDVPQYRRLAYDALDRIGADVTARLEAEMRGHGLIDEAMAA